MEDTLSVSQLVIFKLLIIKQGLSVLAEKNVIAHRHGQNLLGQHCQFLLTLKMVSGHSSHKPSIFGVGQKLLNFEILQICMVYSYT